MSKFETILSPARLENLRKNGAICFDVDDTLLARRKNISESDQVFSESPAAAFVPLLLNAGVKVCIITGHGWTQLKERFVLPLTEEISKNFPEKREEILQRFFVYANRGATKMIWKNGDYAEDVNYGREFSFDETNLIQIREIFAELAKSFNEDFAKQKDFYRQSFPKFAFDELPPEILEREQVVLGLRPIPSEAHCEKKVFESPRQRLFLIGCELLKKAKLEAKYELTQSGKSTLEITKKAVSKKVAFKDLLFQITKEKEISLETVENSSIYVGDEFASGGNDFIISQSFPHCLCLSVACAKRENSSEKVLFLHDCFQLEGIPATSFLIAYILKFLT